MVMMRTGVWLVGARGSVATTAMVGAASVRAGLAPPVGCVTCLPDFADLRLPAFADLVFGGHDIVDVPLEKRAEQLVGDRVLPRELFDQTRSGLAEAEAEIRVGVRDGDDHPQARTVARLVADLDAFRDRLGLARVVMVNVASTEGAGPPAPPPDRLADLRAALDRGASPLPVSALYAYAAMVAGCSYVDFTPGAGARLPALDELARQRGVPYAGSDGKTGETLVKSVLVSLFALRGLRVTSWSGTNLLGGGDGAALADPDRALNKIDSKRRILADTLGYPVPDHIAIRNVPALGEWKTAWDHVTFTGFLGGEMAMQFTWQGCDSALAAPLVLDLARLTAAAHAAGVAGPLAELAFFFKNPVGTREHQLVRQYDTLRAWARAVAA